MARQARILLLDDQQNTLARMLGGPEHAELTPEVAETIQDAARMAEAGSFDAAIVSLAVGREDPMPALDALRRADPTLPILVSADPHDSDRVTQAIKAGAYNWVPTDIEPSKLSMVIEGLLSRKGLQVEPLSLEGGLREEPGFRKIVGSSPKMQEVFKSIETVVGSDVPVLVQGETGTGKELVAKALHYRGPRRKYPFYAVNCAAIPENLLESELFGHERGAFTGAIEMRKGKFELAHMGSLFLDEIGEMSSQTQAKILRVVEETAFERVGSSNLIHVDVRIISATNKDLRKEVREGNFREDLYYRLAVYPLVLPPLRERVPDIVSLAEYFLDRYSHIGDEEGKVLSDASRALLAGYAWPGNVRQVQNCIRRAILLARDRVIEPEHFDLPDEDSRDYSLDASLDTKRDTLLSLLQRDEVLPLHEIEGLLIRQALKLTDGNITEAADKLGISRSTIYRKLQEHGVSL